MPERMGRRLWRGESQEGIDDGGPFGVRRTHEFVARSRP
jgi:hypothetical protein